MKKIIYILSALVFILGCSENNTLTVTKIKNYINEVNGRTDLMETVSEMTGNELEDTSVDKFKIYDLKDGQGFIYKITQLTVESSLASTYEYYYKSDTLNYARILQIDNAVNDTIIDSEYYYQSQELLLQLDRQREFMDSEIVKQTSAFAWYYMKQIKN